MTIAQRVWRRERRLRQLREFLSAFAATGAFGLCYHLTTNGLWARVVAALAQ